MLNPDFLASFQQLCAGHERFLVISHVRPDGDAYGSTLGLALSLRAMGKDVQTINHDGLSPLFEFLPGSATLTKPAAGVPDKDRVVIAVDSADQKRLGPAFDAWKRVPDVN